MYLFAELPSSKCHVLQVGVVRFSQSTLVKGISKNNFEHIRSEYGGADRHKAVSISSSVSCRPLVMEFGSEYVFISSKNEFEEVDESSLERGLLSIAHESSAANDDGEVG